MGHTHACTHKYRHAYTGNCGRKSYLLAGCQELEHLAGCQELEHLAGCQELEHLAGCQELEHLAGCQVLEHLIEFHELHSLQVCYQPQLKGSTFKPVYIIFSLYIC